jgi:hypothetical protein
MRLWSVAAGLSLALPAAGCGGSGKAAAPTAAASPSKFPSAVPTGSPSVVLNGVRPGREKATRLDGKWAATTSGVKVALYLYRGAAAINKPRFCSGTIDAAGAVRLTCADKDTGRTVGKAVLKGTTLTVTWSSGPTDHFTRAK